jgi:hypothetical protein
MVIDRTFAQQHYDNIIKQFDIIPIKNRDEALHRLHAVLNKAYIVSLSEKLDANFRKVMPRTVKTLFKKVGLERYFEEFTARKLAGILSKQIAQFGLGDDIGTLTLPECIEVVHFKFLTFANGLLKDSRLSDQYIQGCIHLLHNLHKISLEASAKWKAVASALTNEEIAERIQDYYAKVYKDAPPPNPSTMEQLVEYVRVQLAHYPLYRNLDKIIERTSIKDLTDPIFIDRLKADCMDEEKIKLDCIEVINGACSKFSPNRNAWLERNKSNYDFTFDQSESGSDYVLEDGCCWAISFEWLKRLTQLGSAPVGSYKEFMPPPKPIKVSDNLDIKPSLKRFTEEIEATMNESRITPHMRRMQAQGALERRLANKFQDVVAERLGLHSQILFYKLNTKVENFLTEWMDQLELNAHLGNVLKPLNNVVMFGGKGNGAHAMILQIDPERNLYRFGDPNEGMLTFPTREIFIREMSEYMHIYYDDFHTFYVTAYPKKE